MTTTAYQRAAAAHQDVLRAALGPARFREIKGAAMIAGDDMIDTFDAMLTGAEKTRITEALDGAPLDHDHLIAVLGAERYAEIWQTVLMPSTPDRYRDAAIRAALERELTTAEREALAPAGDPDDVCPITGMTRTELAALEDAPAEAPAKRPAPTGPRASTRRVAGGVDGRDFAYVGLVKLGRKVLAECGHEHANRDWSTGVAGGSAKSCAESILDGARRPATAEHVAGRLRTAPVGLRPGAGFAHPAGTIEAARAAAEANAAGYLAAVATVREHLHTQEEPLPGTEAAPERITVDTDATGETCDQGNEPATHRVLVDGFPLYLVCAGHVARVQGFAREALAARDEPTTAAPAAAETEAPAPPAAAEVDEPDTTCPVCGCEAYEDDLLPVGDSDPMCWECRREME